MHPFFNVRGVVVKYKVVVTSLVFVVSGIVVIGPLVVDVGFVDVGGVDSGSQTCCFISSCCCAVRHICGC